MNKDIMRAMGFGEHVALAEMNLCPFCHVAVTEADFRDELSRKEWSISGFCQGCQDIVFGDEE